MKWMDAHINNLQQPWTQPVNTAWLEASFMEWGDWVAIMNNNNNQLEWSVSTGNVVITELPAPTQVITNDPTLPQEPKVVQPPVVPVVIPPVATPVVPPEPTPPAIDGKSQLEDLDSILDWLLNDINTGKKEADQIGAPAPIEAQKSTDVNDNWKISLDKDKDISTEGNELKEKIMNMDLKLREAQIKTDYLEQQLTKKAVDESEMYEKFKNLERDLKKHKAWQIDVDVEKLNDYIKLYKESDTLYNERWVLAEASKVIENITKLDMTPYLMEYYKWWSWFNKESGSVSEPVAKKDSNVGLDKRVFDNSFL